MPGEKISSPKILKEVFADLRKKAHKQTEKETIGRIKANPAPTEDELYAGAFYEMVEPQVRDAVFEMRRKGYSTESSGFGGETGELQQIDGNFEIDKATENKLRPLGVQVIRQGQAECIPWKTLIRFSTDSVLGPTIEKLKERWDGIVGLLPNLGRPAEPSISGATEDFVKQYAPERTDVLQLIKELRERYSR